MNILGIAVDKFGREVSNLILIENDPDIKSEDDFYKHMSLINEYINHCKRKCIQKIECTNKFIIRIYFSLNSKSLILYEEDPTSNKKLFKHMRASKDCCNSLIYINIYNRKRIFHHFFNYEYIQTSSEINNLINIINIAKSSVVVEIPYFFGLFKREYTLSQLENMDYDIDLWIYLFEGKEIKVLHEVVHTSKQTQREINKYDRNGND